MEIIFHHRIFWLAFTLGSPLIILYVFRKVRLLSLFTSNIQHGLFLHFLLPYTALCAFIISAAIAVILECMFLSRHKFLLSLPLECQNYLSSLASSEIPRALRAEFDKCGCMLPENSELKITDKSRIFGKRYLVVDKCSEKLYIIKKGKCKPYKLFEKPKYELRVYQKKIEV